ncbi:unnamed protein product [Orchesella dallaii]|uniref:Kinesin light chain n=1 Tax=Orchesella dallaii TaxID=48710 RepID=A0ABP1RI89_9HEXA
MEEQEKNHILDNLDTLVRTTFCRSIFMAQLVANGVLGLDDIHLIDSIPNELQKSLVFYQLIVTRENSYGLLLEALNETSQSGAAQVLKQLHTSSQSSASSSQTESSATRARNRVRKFLDGDQNQINFKKTKEDLERDAHKSKPVRFDVRPPVQLFTGRQQELLELHEKLQESQTHGEEEHEVLFALRLLVKYSMLESQPKEGTLSIHRLVQEVTRIELKTDHKEEITISEMLQLLQKNSVSLSAVDHSIVAWNFGIKYSQLVQQFSNFPTQVTKQLFDLQRYKEADRFGNKGLLDLNKAQIDPKHVDIFKIKYQLTKVGYEQGNYKESLEVFKDMLQNAKETIGELDPDTIEMDHYIGMALNRQGKYSESLQIFEEVLEKKKKAFGEDDVRTVDTVLNMAVNLSGLGEYKDALELYENALKNYKRLLGDNHRKVFMTTQNMALLYRGMGHLDKATEMLKGVYTTAKTTMESDTLTVLIGHNLALFLHLQGNHEEAYDVATHVFEKRKQILGPEHSETLSTSNVLGKLLRCQGKYEEALLIHQNVYQKLAKSCGKSHPHTLSAKLDISYIWSAIGMKEEALVSLQEVLESQMTKLGPNNHQTLATQVEIAKVLEEMKRLEEAKRLLEDVEGNVKENFGEEHVLLPKIGQLIQKIETNITCSDSIEIGK